MDTLPFDIELINNELLSKFGRLGNKARFRIVWSDTQTEHRKTSFMNGIYFPYPRVIEVKKYEYIKERWVMERWIPHSLTDEIISIDGGTYEPIWTFQDSKGNALRPIWKAAEIVALAAEGKFFERRTEKMDSAAHEAEIEKEAEEFEDMLGLGTNYGNQQTNFVAPVFLDSRKQRTE